MGNQKINALLIGGAADGRIIAVAKSEPRLECGGSVYILKDALPTKKFGVVQTYVLDGIPPREERQRLQIIGKAL